MGGEPGRSTLVVKPPFVFFGPLFRHFFLGLFGGGPIFLKEGPTVPLNFHVCGLSFFSQPAAFFYPPREWGIFTLRSPLGGIFTPLLVAGKTCVDRPLTVDMGGQFLETTF